MMPLIKTQKACPSSLTRKLCANTTMAADSACWYALGQARGRLHDRTMHTHSAMAETVVRPRDRGKWWWVRLHCSHTPEHFSELEDQQKATLWCYWLRPPCCVAKKSNCPSMLCRASNARPPPSLFFVPYLIDYLQGRGRRATVHH
jgi:hypothetical protein